MRAAIYVRVSTDHDGQKLSPEHQLMTCMEHAAELGLETDRNWVYNDAGQSGTEMDHRTEVKRLVLDARQGKFDAIIFTAISRFARNLSDALSLKKRLEGIYGVRIVSVEEGYDTAIEGRNSEMIFTVHAMVAAHKSQEMSKAIRRGLRQSAVRGRHIGNAAPYGYVKSEENRLIPDPESADIIRLIFKRYLTGMGSNAIAKELNRNQIPTARTARGIARTKWQASTITAILHNPVYTGTLVANKWRNGVDIEQSRFMDRSVRRQMLRDEHDWIILADNHEPIIDIDAFQAVQHLLELKRTHKGIRRNSQLLSGLMRCGNCGGAMVISGSGKRADGRYSYIRCSTVKRIGKEACLNQYSIPYRDVLEAVLAPLRQIQALDDSVNKWTEQLSTRLSHVESDSQLQRVEERMKQNQARQESILRAYVDELFSLSEIRSYKKDLDAERERLRDERSNLQEQMNLRAKQCEPDEIRDALNIFHNTGKQDLMTIRMVLKMMVEEIVFSADKRIHIYYKFQPDHNTSLYTSLM